MDEHDGLCPECQGMGWYATQHVWYPEDEAWEEVYCRACDGTGTLSTRPTEEETNRSAYTQADSRIHAERENGRETLTFRWPIQPR